MITNRISCMTLVIAGMFCVPQLASAEDAISHPAKTAIGGSKSSEPVASLAVVNARGASLEGNTLTLTGVSTPSFSPTAPSGPQAMCSPRTSSRNGTRVRTASPRTRRTPPSRC